MGAAALRAAGSRERDEAVRNPDFLAPRFIALRPSLTTFAKLPGSGRLVRAVAKRRIPGSYYFEIARTRCMDDVVRAEVAAGVEQLVLLGAGYDSRAYRMPELEGVRIFEVDHPITSGLKRKRLKAIFGEVAELGLEIESDVGPEDAERYLTASDGRVIGRPYGFGGIAHARVPARS